MAKSKPDKLAREVVELSMRFHRARLWLRVSSDALFRVRLDGGETVLCCITGSHGEDLGLVAGLGIHAQESLELEYLEGLPYGPREGLELLNVLFTALANIPDENRRIFTLAGRSFSKDSAAPWLTGCQENERARPMGRAHQRILCEVLRTVLEAHAQGKLQPRELGAKRRMSEYRLEAFGKKAEVHETIVTVPAIDRSVVPENAPRHFRTVQAARGVPKSGHTWVVGSQSLPQFEDGSRAEMVLGVVLDADQMLPPGVIPTGDPDASFDDTLPGLLASWFGLPGIQLPAEIIFESYGTLRELGGTLNTLGIRFSHQPHHPKFLEIWGGFADRMRPLADACDRELELRSPIQPDDLERWKHLNDLVSRELVEQMGSFEKAVRSHAFPRFFGNRRFGEYLLEAHMNHGVGHAFVEWYLFHYRAQSTSKTVAEKCLAKADPDFPSTRLLQARIDAQLAPYRITQIDPGASLILENLYSGERTRIQDKSLSKTAREGMAFVARVHPAGSFHFAVPLTPPTTPGDLLASLDEGTRFSSEPFLPHGIRHLGLLWHQPPTAPPRLANTDGDPLEDLTLLYRTEDPTGLAERLGQLPELDTEDANHWDWTRSQPDRPTLGNVLIARLELIQDELLVHVNSTNRAREVRALLDPIPGLTHIRIGPATPPESPSCEVLPSPEEQQLFTKAIHDRILSWVDEPVPALRNLTPKAAYQDPTLRDQVVQLIRTYPDSHSPWGVILAPRDEMLRRVKGE